MSYWSFEYWRWYWGAKASGSIKSIFIARTTVLHRTNIMKKITVLCCNFFTTFADIIFHRKFCFILNCDNFCKLNQLEFQEELLLAVYNLSQSTSIKIEHICSEKRKSASSGIRFPIPSPKKTWNTSCDIKKR